MPTYQGAAFVEAALESVRRQEAGHLLEIIAIDDGSVDQTAAILDAAATDLPIQLIRHEKPGSWVASTNEGIQRASGAFCSFLHQDDWWAPDRLATLAALRAERPDATLLLSPSFFVSPHDASLGKWRLPFRVAPQATVETSVVLERLLVQNFLSIAAPCFSLGLARAVGPLDDSLWFLADWQFWATLASRARIGVTGETLSGFRVHDASQTEIRTRDEDDLRRQYQAVQQHVLGLLGREANAVAVRRATRAGVLNREISLALAAMHHGGRASWRRVFAALFQCYPTSWVRFWRDSCLRDRVAARVRLRGGGDR